MPFIPVVLYLSSAVPLGIAWAANRRTSLAHALVWMTLAWLSWLPVFLAGAAWSGMEIRYVALCLTGSAGIAVLGARSPIVRAWNAVLLCLLAVLLLPIAESIFHQTTLLDPLRFVFLAGTLAVGVLNYLPTRIGPGALALGLASSAELIRLMGWVDLDPGLDPICWLVPIGGWIGVVLVYSGRRDIKLLDRIWLTFRDRYGLFWGQRIREQFNRAAANAGWPLHLTWRGFRRMRGREGVTVEEQTAMVETLQAMLKRFAQP